MRTCTVNIQRIPSLDTVAKRTHVPVPRHQLPDPADPNGNNNRVDTPGRKAQQTYDGATDRSRRHDGSGTGNLPARD